MSRSKLFIIISIVAVLILALLIGGFFLLDYFFLKPRGFCFFGDRSTLDDECWPRFIDVVNEYEKVNVTYRFLGKPEEYAGVVPACGKMSECLSKVKCDHSSQTKNFTTICSFFNYYTKDFASCANQLYEKRNDVDCLSLLFNDSSEETDMCVQWDHMQPCIHQQINNICGDVMGLRRDKYKLHADEFRYMICDMVLPIDEDDNDDHEKKKNS
ncbi:unnamed protein product [Caenorhabditis bovis]|uniref:T20D4.11-like domain-containing protein n=1 Tax=Caenorhabditis bovis TaxID=2654633 RepID=A0A8S1EG13_9PELO|nr:unnamed protein product [Caenorhabditis bovis]